MVFFGRFVTPNPGPLFVLTADRTGFKILGQGEVISKARDAWGPPALTGRPLYLRDAARLFAIELE
jgi:hypothetical protein